MQHFAEIESPSYLITKNCFFLPNSLFDPIRSYIISSITGKRLLLKAVPIKMFYFHRFISGISNIFFLKCSQGMELSDFKKMVADSIWSPIFRSKDVPTNYCNYLFIFVLSSALFLSLTKFYYIFLNWLLHRRHHRLQNCKRHIPMGCIWGATLDWPIWWPGLRVIYYNNLWVINYNQMGKPRYFPSFS